MIFYTIMNGCDNGHDFCTAQFRYFLKNSRYKLSSTGIKNQWAIIDIYNKAVGSVMKIKD